MKPTLYWAHSSRESKSGPDSRVGWQSLAEHLKAVSRIAADLANDTRPKDIKLIALSRLAGLFHDFGKYSDRFQRMLETGSGTCQHSIHGAMLAYFGSGTGNGKAALNTVMASIAGHHAGLADWPDYAQKLSNPQFKAEMESLIPIAAGDSSVLAEHLANLSRNTDYVPRAGLKARYDLFIRML